jgi:release factor glutamine methyltransferase
MNRPDKMTFTEVQASIVRPITDRYGAGEAASIARIVLEDVFNWYAPTDRVLRDAEKEQLEVICARLVAGEPLQYVLGAADFFGLKFKVTPAVLIPRQETEELVATVLQYMKSNALTQPNLLDIGVGSGCIGLTLKKKYPSLHLTGLEKSKDALAVAVENAGKILGKKNVGVSLLQGDILDRDGWQQWPDFDLVVSNPPYIPESEKHLVPNHVKDHEPGLALFVESSDPLLFYRVIADFCLKKLQPGGALFFECNEFNAVEAAEILQKKGFIHVQLEKDLSRADRILWAQKR